MRKFIGHRPGQRMLKPRYSRLIRRYGRDILLSPGMQREKGFLQHGAVSVYRHSVRVAAMCLLLSRALLLRVDERKLVRGALLHDYFLYDWHQPGHRWHGFRHPDIALENACRDFELSPVEQNMIKSHMFPLTLRHVPRYPESALLCAGDKLAAIQETLDRRKNRKRKDRR